MKTEIIYSLSEPPLLRGKRIYLRELQLSDVNENYCRWMNDSRVNQYLESRFQEATEESIRQYVQSVIKDRDSILLGIIVTKNDQHIGNIKLGPVIRHHHRAEVGLLLGEREFWGQGFASEALSLLIDYAFNTLNLHKLTAGCYAVNKASAKLFKKCGFKLEGIRKEHCMSQGLYGDGLLFGLVNPGRHDSSNVTE